jgi:hypothetical protein
MICTFASQPVAAADFLFTWKANTDSDLNSYGIYQRREDSPYVRIHVLAADELDDPASPSYLVTGLESGSRYTFAVTAVFNSGEESDFFAQHCVRVGETLVDCDTGDTGATVIVSCFISAAGRN